MVRGLFWLADVWLNQFSYQIFRFSEEVLIVALIILIVGIAPEIYVSRTTISLQFAWEIIIEIDVLIRLILFRFYILSCLLNNQLFGIVVIV